MKKSNVFVILLFLLQTFGTKAQLALGVEVNGNRDYFSIKDNGNEIGSSKRYNLSFGIDARYLFKSRRFLQAGLIFKDYKTNIAFKRFGDQIVSNGFPCLQVPVLFGRRLKHVGQLNTSYLLPQIGLDFNFILLPSDVSNMRGLLRQAGDTLHFNASNSVSQAFFICLHLGLYTEVKLNSHFTAGGGLFFHQGLTSVMSNNISYQYNSSPLVQASQRSKGSYWSFCSVKLFYHFGLD